MKLAIAWSALLTIGCATASPDDQLPDASSSGCQTGAVQGLVGHPATSDLGAEAVRRSGARRLRWIRPGDAVTMDFSADRLNAHLDAANRVERFACG